MKEGLLMNWKKLHHPFIKDCYLISSTGKILVEHCDEALAYEATYHSTNGYDYALFNVKDEYRVNDNPLMLFPIDEILAMVFVPVPEELNDKRIKVIHINGDTHDCSTYNLKWVEDVEEWRDVTYPGIYPDRYEISSWGNVRSKRDEYIVRYLNDDYDCCYLHDVNDKKRLISIHRLVWFQFIKSPDDPLKSFVNHIDTIRHNNRLKNIETSSPKMNVVHSSENRIHKSGISPIDIRRVCEYIVKYNGDNKKILEQLNQEGIVMEGRYLNIIKQKNAWRNISDEYFDDVYCNRNLTKPAVEEVCKSLIKYKGNLTDTQTALAKKKIYVSKSVISNIRRKAAWSSISDKFFDDKYFTIKRVDGPRIIMSEDEVHLVCRLINEYSGRISQIKRYLDSIDKSHISYDAIKDIKNKSSWVRISDLYFKEHQYDQLLNERDVVMICEKIVEYKGIRGCRLLVYNELKDIIPNLSISEIIHIYHKNAWRKISDKFF